MFYSGKVDHDHDEKIIVVIICLYHKSELEGKFYNSQYRNNYDTKTLCLFDISEVHFVTLKALSLALVLPCRTALVIACLNELTLLSPREGDPQHFHPPAGEGTPALLSEALMTAPFQGLLCNFPESCQPMQRASGITLRSCRMDKAYSHSRQKFCLFSPFLQHWNMGGSR